MHQGRSNIRWIVVALLFFATTINYIDRQVIGLLKPYIEKDLHWDDADYGYVVTAFQMAYAIGLVLSGHLLDKFGTRLGYTLAVIIWTLGALMHAVACTVTGFGMARAVLGIGEAANFPAAVKTVADWFPKKERALATGLFNSGSNIGAIAAPIVVSGVTLTLGWRWAFVITGLLGFVWVVFWLLFYKSPHQHPGVSQLELDYIASDSNLDDEKAAEAVTWKSLFFYKQTYAICLSRFVTEWVWWFFLFWMPDFLSKTQHIDLKQSILPLIIIYTMAGFGGVLGGFISSYLIKNGRPVDFSRRTAIFICALLVLPLAMAPHIHNIWLVCVVAGMATAGHQGWAANILPSYPIYILKMPLAQWLVYQALQLL